MMGQVIFRQATSTTTMMLLQSHDKNREVIKGLKEHFVLCVFCDEKSPDVGLASFVMPLRASCLSYSQLKPIVIVGNEAFLRREWQNLKIFPNIYIRTVSSMLIYKFLYSVS